MLSARTSAALSPLKNPLLYSSVAVFVVLLFVLFVMYSRWNDARIRALSAAREHAEQQRARDRAAVEQLGGKDFAILNFYASPRVIERGESAKLCYGVSNARSVTLQPQPHPVWPSAANCVDVSPTKTTTYTIVAFDAAGNSQSQTVDLVVR